MFINVVRNTNYSIMLFGRNLYTYFNHIMISFNADKIEYNGGLFTPQRIDLSNLESCDFGYGSNEKFKKYLLMQSNSVKGYMLENEEKEVIGYYWLFFQGANELEYKIKSNNIALLSDVYVPEKYRGRGYASELVRHACKIANKDGVHTILAAVRQNNLSAFNAYKKIGYTVERKYRFVRILKKNIPYYSL